MKDCNKIRPRKWLRHGLVALWLIVTTLVLGEIGVRIINVFGPSTFLFRQFDPDLGVSPIPSVQGNHRRCYDGYVYINQHGMRDKERTIEKPGDVFRIAVFSDSIVESVHVKPDEVITEILENKLNEDNLCGGRCEVLNFSVGGYSTIQYYLRYKRDGRKFNNDLVLMVFTDNDLPLIGKETSHEDKLEQKYVAIGSHYPAPRLSRQEGEYVILSPEKPTTSRFMQFLFQHSRLFYHIYKVFVIHINTHKAQRLHDWVPVWSKFQPNYTFLDPENEYSKRAWNATEHLLDRFGEAVKQDGAEFMIVHWGYDVGSNPWYQPVPPGTEFPESFDPQYASKWFEAYGKRKGIRVYNLGRDLTEYIRRNELVSPYLSFSCDRHFNPKGQRVVADLLYAQLKEAGLHR